MREFRGCVWLTKVISEKVRKTCQLTPGPTKASRAFRDSLFAFALGLAASPIQSAEPSATTGAASSAFISSATREAEVSLNPIRIAPGFKAELFAAQTMISNPVSLAIDERGRAFVTETLRRTRSIIDIRAHTNWIDADLSFRAVEDRSNFFQKVLIPANKSLQENASRDLNGDGKFDASDLTVDSERIRVLEDRDGDGAADLANRFAAGFNTSVTGVAGSVLVRGSNVWFMCIPDLWLLRDSKNDGQADSRRPLHHGFGVHIGSGNPEARGLCYGPDGWIYFAIGDCGLNVVANNRTFFYPDTGAVLRCRPNGSGLEVIATGLRQPTGLAFDALGNLWTIDEPAEDSEKARLLYVLEGADYGWHIGWRRSGTSRVWKTEKLGELFPTNTAAYILPPIAHLGHGSAGFAFFPGTGLPPRYENHFLLCDRRAGILSFALQPKAAGHEVIDLHEFAGGLNALDLDFGPEGSIYVIDSAETSMKTNRSRILHLFDPSLQKDPALAETKRLLSEGVQKRSVRDLLKLLEHRDRRVRQEAQFALVDKGVAVTNQLFRIAAKHANLLARLHALWALRQIGAANSEVLSAVVTLTTDSDPEIRAQAAKALGENRFTEALEPLAKLLLDPAPRVRLFAALSLGKLGRQDATDPILLMLRENADRDPLLRHAGVTALAWLNDMNALLAAAKDSSASVRLSVLLAMRRLARPEIAMFLYDSNAALVLEAARAIYDLPIESALSQLAVMARQTSRIASLATDAREPSGPRAAVLRRSLNANFRLGKLENALALAEFAGRKEFPEDLRAEALERLAQWAKPVYRDPLLGLWRPLPAREARPASLAARSELAGILKEAPDSVRIAAIHAAMELEISSVTPALFELVANSKLSAPLRVAALAGLGALKDPKLTEAVAIAVVDPAEPMRAEAARWLAHLKPSDAIGQIATTLERGSLSEKQNALRTLADITSPATDQIISAWLDLLNDNKVPRELQLDLLELARKRAHESLQSKLQKYEAARPANDPLAAYAEVLHGGDAPRGQKLFFERAELGCSRCHRVGGNGGDQGPDLSKIGANSTRERLLESMLVPDKNITAGYETIIVRMKSGKMYRGRVKNETETELLLTSPDEGFVVLGKAQIQSREKGSSLMPADAPKLLSKRELRDLIEYLAGLR